MKFQPGLCLFLVLLAGGSGSGQEAPSFKAYSSPDGTLGLTLPAAWIVTPGDDANAAMDLKITLPGPSSARYGQIALFWVKSMHRAKAQPFLDRPVQLKRYKGEKSGAGQEPLPHLDIQYALGSGTQEVLIIYRVIQGRGFSLTASFGAPAFASIREALFRAAESLTAGVEAWEPWPPDPEGYVEKSRGSYRYLKHPDFEGSELGMNTFLLQEEKAFERIYGPLSMDHDWLPAVLLHGEETDFSPLLPAYASGKPDAFCDYAAKRLFCRNLPPKKTQERALLAREASKLFYTLQFGHVHPPWLCVAEGEIAFERALTGKDLPYLSEDRLARLPRSPLPFPQVISELQEKDLLSFMHHCLLYGALFRLGDKTYRNGFKLFLEAFQESGDWESAAEEHLLSLDPRAMAEEAVLLKEKRLKPVLIKLK